jgi:hypothetical protein
MSIIDGPRVVTSGLVLNLDAANTKSYPGSGLTWTDLTGRGNNGTLTNGPTFSSANGGRIVLDGSNDHVVIADNNVFDFGTGDFAVDLWVYPLDISGSRGLILLSYYYTGYSGIYFYASGGKLSLFTNVLTPVQESGTSLTANVWNHIVLTRISGVGYMYKNAQVVYTWAFTFNISVNTNIVLGYDAVPGFTPDPFIGYFSNVKIYSAKGLTAAEIAQNFNALRGRYGI